MLSGFDGLRFSHWQADIRDDGVVVLSLDRQDAPVNALSQDVLLELGDLLERIAIDPPKGVVIRSAKANGFIAGADLKEFQEFDRRGTVNDAIRRGQATFQKLAELPCPTVAAIHGFCMGGGTEIALACRYRVASSDASTRIGLPETKLGIFPGWGGSARLPRLIGAPAAMDLMLTGRSVSASAARAIGLVDKVAAPAVLLDTAVALALTGSARPLKQRATAWASNNWLARKLLAPQMRKQVARKARREHYPAPYALIGVWERSGGGGIQARLDAERKAVVKLASTPTARNLIRIFFLTERLKALGGKDGGGMPPPGIRHVHVVGAGVMGGDIAAWSAYKGFEVTLQDREQRFIDGALTRAGELFAKRVKDDSKRPAVAARLKGDLSGDGVPLADLVIEAIVENPQAKRELYQALEPRMQPAALLSTNTSSIPLSELREHIQRPAQFAGLHYFNPVAQMPLVEIVCHDGLAADNQKRLAAFCKAIDKLPVPVAGTPGFLVNRVLFPYLLEAATAYAEGIPGPAIDKAAVTFGMPMGPIELIDTVGLDVAAGVGAELAPFLRLPIPAALQTVEPGKRGKKDGQGLYAWENGRAKKPDVDKDYQAPADLEDRLILPLLNEAVACLHDGVVADADLLDAGVIFGTGFAPFRGGPIQHIRAAGADALLERLRALQARYGERFAPRPGWDAPALREPVA
ncbi:3-hydroxyacyl-CoA dehydrogenase NAD-binding domain-containing protein [Xanthomonas translucens]|uniref:enoyl-CoA hydratase n=3 Tax=Xanthomonas campestris pv. translucens TaxID=343 RepID=A0A109HDE5_XANCT|nr:3-hydroxyacyl-CoA dehydrogenase NAD-binding domain-containing protein [Xanthomonas translucens]KWV10133.1 3-hydroxyacyl-CoA dehydrogenase [Xanthomonas translucens]MCC8446305.1 3-hydroxyacyl-CoA dehydrogenase NAD-binding domain-containing protein [Xanthomonas translucens pv. translucens]MCT8284473.1 3-hydroxyacyl-CoA dehydrogenase NAD-binding domain-containing protein [Xanthomonas translucens pv. translucens]MCT8302131.1 3-hydroxyacyl-CoA dehydrogenase NAD-binding domain-containing protein [X